MPVPDSRTLDRWRTMTVLDSNGDKVGAVNDLYMDDFTGETVWALVHSGLFGLRSSFVPVNDAVEVGGDLQVPYTKQQIKDAASIEPGGELTEEQTIALYEHYQLSGWGTHKQPAAGAGAADAQEPVGGGPPPQEAQQSGDAAHRARRRLRRWTTDAQVPPEATPGSS